MRYLLDTNILVALAIRATPSVVSRAGKCDAGDLVTSTVVLAEVAYGSERGLPPDPARLLSLIDEIPALDFDRDAAMAYARLPFKRAGFDRLIGAHAVALGLILVTANEDDFRDIPGLQIENWAQ